MTLLLPDFKHKINESCNLQPHIGMLNLKHFYLSLNISFSIFLCGTVSLWAQMRQENKMFLTMTNQIQCQHCRCSRLLCCLASSSPFPFIPTPLSLTLTPPLSTTNVQVKEPGSHGGESLGWVWWDWLQVSLAVQSGFGWLLVECEVRVVAFGNLVTLVFPVVCFCV